MKEISVNLDLTAAQRDAIGLTYVLDKLDCATPYGRELAKQLMPYSASDLDALLQTHDNMDAILALRTDKATLLDDLRDIMAHFGNIRPLLQTCQNTPLGEVEMFEVKGFLLTFEHFLPAFAALNTNLHGINFTPTTAALDLLDPAKKRVAPFYIEDDASPILAEIRSVKRRLPSDSADRTEIAAKEDVEEMRVLAALSRRLAAFVPALLDNINNLAKLDFTIAKAKLAYDLGGCRPSINPRRFALLNMHNPMICDSLGGNFTKVSLTLDVGTTIITGANMGGKSVAIRTAALNAALCRLGFFVFAEAADIPLFDGICLISEDMQDSRGGLSSFGAEVAALKRITEASCEHFLFVALDEPARATNPAEGTAITRSLAAFFAQSGCVCLISSHYDNVAQPGMKHYQVAGLKADADINTTLTHDWMDYRLIEANSTTPPPRDALRICEIMGLDAALIESIKADLH